MFQKGLYLAVQFAFQLVPVHVQGVVLRLDGFLELGQRGSISYCFLAGGQWWCFWWPVLLCWRRIGEHHHLAPALAFPLLAAFFVAATRALDSCFLRVISSLLALRSSECISFSCSNS